MFLDQEMRRNPPHPDIEIAEAALDGEADAVAAVMEMLRSPALAAAIVARGATATEAHDLVNDLIGDCFGGERAKGGLHRLLGRYNGGCPLSAFFRRIATNRLISLKRASRPMVALDDDEDGPRELPAPGGRLAAGADDALIALLRDAIARARERIDAEKLVLVRLMVAYEVPQKRLGTLMGWHESKISRAKTDLLAELRTRIMEEVRLADPWLELTWEDFMELCAESIDLFAA
jgi:DNA-directed RNA polymerase specialized sigma24 family protein